MPDVGSAQTALAPAAPAASTPPKWPGPGWPMLQPTVHLSAVGTRAGYPTEPSITCCPDGSLAIVTEPEHSFWSSTNLTWHAPDLAALLVLLPALWLARRIYLTIRDRLDKHIRGHWYCRTCDYDLTPPGTNLSSAIIPTDLHPICSECGVDTTRRRPRRATSRSARLFPPIVAFLLACGVATPIFVWTLEPLPPYYSTDFCWPSPLLGEVASNFLFLPHLQRRNEGAGLPESITLSVFSLPAGTLLARHSIACFHTFIHITPDNAWCALLTSSDEWTRQQLYLLNLRDPAQSPAPIPFPGRGQFALAPDQPFPNRLLIQQVARKDGQPWGIETTPRLNKDLDVSLRLWSLDFNSREWSSLVDLTRTNRAVTNFPPVQMMCWPDTRSPESSAFTVIIQMNVNSTPRKKTYVEIVSTSRAATHSKSLELPGTYLLTHRPSPDLKFATVSHMASQRWIEETLDLDTGSSTPLPSKAWSVDTPDHLLSLVYPAIPPRFVDAAGTIVGVPAIGTGCCFPSMDPNGHWAWSAQVNFFAPPWLTYAFGYRFRSSGSIALWDLEPLKAPLRANQSTP